MLNQPLKLNILDSTQLPKNIQLSQFIGNQILKKKLEILLIFQEYDLF